MLYLIELEHLPQRYTKQWSDWFSDHCLVNKIEHKIISGSPMKFNKGEFLDINRTNIYKSEQIIKVAELFDKGKIKNGDTFFIYDGWHYITTALRYMADLQDIKIKIVSYWHAGSYDKNDFLGRKNVSYWASFCEQSWLNSVDKVLVATEYHRKLLLEERYDNIIDNIHVVGFPFVFDFSFDVEKKENIIVFPHRIAPEKQPELFDVLSKEFPEYKFIKTIEVTKTKKQYYDILKRAKIVWSGNLQETFGIGTMEGVMFGSLPLVPNRLCYPEMYDKEFIYDDLSVMRNKVSYMMKNYDNLISGDSYKNTIGMLNSKTNINNLFREII